MQRQNLRVVLASENTETRSFLSKVIEQEEGVDIVGQAQDASRALMMTKNLIPDVAVIDCYLPYAIGAAPVPLSRINGFDAAQTILQESPNTKVLLLSNLNGETLPEISMGRMAILTRRKDGVDTPISLRGLVQDTATPGSIVFAGVDFNQPDSVPQQVTRASDKVIFFGAIVLAVGFLMTLTVFLAWPVGIPVALAGGAAVLLGLAGKGISSLWRKMKTSK